MRPQPCEIWFFAAAKITRLESIAVFNDNQEKVLEYLWENFPGLYMGAPNEVHFKEAIFLISRDLSQSVSTSKKKERFEFLARGFEQGNLTLPGWDVPLGPVYIKISREENYSQQERFRPLYQAEKFIDAFRVALESPAHIDREAMLGQILVSAILFGGLINRKWLKPFQVSLQKRLVFQEESICWVDMEEIKDGDQAESNKNEATNPAKQRLILDHLTRLLIYRYLRMEETGHQNPMSLDSWNNISRYLKSTSFQVSSMPKSLSELCTWAFARYLTALPHSLVAYACGKLKATSLPTGPWLRTISGKAIPVSLSVSSASIDSSGTRPKIIVNKNIKKTDQQRLLSDLLKSLRFNKKSSKKYHKDASASKKIKGKVSPLKARRIIAVFLHNNKTCMSATLQLLLHWSIRLLSEKVSHLELRHKNNIRTKSADRYLLSVGYTLVEVAGNLPLQNLDPQDLATLYEQIILRLGNNDYAKDRLRQFHGFLQTFYNVQSMDWGDLLGSEGRTTSEVNANIVSAQVYNTVITSLGWGKAKLTRWQTLHIITLILLYRCGLRPSELQALRLIDVQGVTIYEILIRNSRLNDIKTNNGIRRLPISKMLRKDELELFLNYYRMRLEEDSTHGGGLFLAHPAHLGRLLSDEELFTPIRERLRFVTKDDSLLLYHLRHSFLTWTDTILQLDKAKYAWEIPASGSPAEDKEIIRDLFKTLGRNEHLGRKDQYLLAMLAGHSSPETTHRHYCHLLDLILGLHLINPEIGIPLNYKSAMALTGLKRPTVFGLLKVPSTTHQLQKVVMNEASRFKEELRHPQMAQATPIKHAKELLPLSVLPPWEEAIESICKDKQLISLRRSKSEWEFASSIYEGVRALDGRKIKTARKVIAYANDNYNERWGGISITVDSNAKLLVSFLKECDVSVSHILAVYHPLKNQPGGETDKTIKHWAGILGISPSKIFVGECAPDKLHEKKLVTVKITSQLEKNKNIRLPKLSLGFMIAIKLLHKQLYPVCASDAQDFISVK